MLPLSRRVYTLSVFDRNFCSLDVNSLRESNATKSSKTNVYITEHMYNKRICMNTV